MESISTAFIQQMEALLGADEAAALFAALRQTDPVVSVRLNPHKPLPYAPVSGRPVPWCSQGYYLSQRPAFTFDPLFHAGCYYVQEASSMFVWQAVGQYVQRPVLALDLCAAPGGKSTLLRSVLPQGSVLLSNEYVPARARVLAENMQKWGHPDVLVSNASPQALGASALQGCVDVLVADVPCSGEGMFRKDEEAVRQWTPALVRQCASLQREIIEAVWPLLKPGGLLVYSTCTYNAQEDEENVDWICNELGAQALPVSMPSDCGIVGNLLHADAHPVYHFMPHHTQGEGFFMAVLRKDGTAAEELILPQPRRSKKGVAAGPKPDKQMLSAAGQWLACADDYALLPDADGVLHAVRPAVQAVWQVLQQCSGVNVLAAGVAVARQKGRDVLPEHALALSAVLRRDAFCYVDVDYATAIAYLRTEVVVLPADTPRGIVLLTYAGVPIGFVKNLGNRANNLYPSAWKIRSQHVPDAPPQF